MASILAERSGFVASAPPDFNPDCFSIVKDLVSDSLYINHSTSLYPARLPDVLGTTIDPVSFINLARKTLLSFFLILFKLGLGKYQKTHDCENNAQLNVHDKPAHDLARVP